VEVERGEQLYFGGGLPLGAETTQALRRGDEGALPELLSLTRTVSGADLVYLGSVHDVMVDVEWHLGTEGSDFGFELPVGQGIGSRVFARDATIEIPDYRNCQYRYPEVSDITDGERARSILAVPVHGEGPSCGAVLYAVRREVPRFSPAQRSLVQRISRSVEPVPGVWRPSRRRSLSGPARRRGGSPRRVAAYPQPVEQDTGRGELAGADRRRAGDPRGPPGPPLPAARRREVRATQGLRREGRAARHSARPGPVSGESSGGSLYLWTPSELRFEGWPDFLEDVAVACNVVIDRAEQGYHRLNQRRSRWVRDVMEGRDGPQLRREGNRLGLPVDSGKVWAIAWSPGGGSGRTH
jgi:hypothetical protein